MVVMRRSSNGRLLPEAAVASTAEMSPLRPESRGTATACGDDGLENRPANRQWTTDAIWLFVRPFNVSCRCRTEECRSWSVRSDGGGGGGPQA